MSTKTITESVVTSVSKGPLVVFVLFGVGFWWVSKMTDHQIEVIEKLVTVLNNPVGATFAAFLGFFLAYGTVLLPVGKFIAGFSREFIEMQKAHNEQHKEHVEASKGMYYLIKSIADACKDMHARFDKFYGGDN